MSQAARPASARALFERVQRHGASLSDYPDGDRLMNRDLARVRFAMDDFAGLQTDLRDLTARMDKHFGTSHDRTLIGWSLPAQTLAHEGQFDEAVTLQRATLARAAARNIPGDEAVAQQTLVLALVLKIAARYEAALAPARQGPAHFDADYAMPTSYRERGR